MTKTPAAHTAATYAAMRATYAATPTTGPRDSKALRGLRVWLWNAQQGRCFDCGVSLVSRFAEDGTELCHTVNTARGYGYSLSPLAVMLGCRRCNVRQAIAFPDSNIPFAYFVTCAVPPFASAPARSVLTTLADSTPGETDGDTEAAAAMRARAGL